MPPAALLLAAGLAQAAPGPFVVLEAGAWRGGGYAREDAGFGHCALTRGGGGSRVTLAIQASGALRLSLEREGLAAAGLASATVVVDGVALGEFPATGSHSGLDVDLGRDPRLGDRLRGASALEVRTPQRPLRGRIAGAGEALDRLRECFALAHSFARPGEAPSLASPGTASPAGGSPLAEARERLRALLRAAGLGAAEFAPPETLGAPTARFAWTSGEVLGLATLESREERSLAELERHHGRVYGTGCSAPPVQHSAPGVPLAGYTLVQTTVECPVRDGVRIAVVTSVLDALDVVSLVHMGLATQRERLEEIHRSLGRLLEVLLRL